MLRDIDRFNRAFQRSSHWQERAFDLKKDQGAISEKSVFKASKSGMCQYGVCVKFNKDVSFLPQTMQIDTQDCFMHRKDAKMATELVK